jgi:hypothetical protein
MKHGISLLLLISMLAFTVGCNQPPDPNEGRQNLRRTSTRRTPRPAAKDSLADTIQVQYTWRDYHDEELDDVFSIDKSVVTGEMAKYGIPEEEYHKDYGSRAAEERYLRTVGFALESERTLVVDYKRVFERNKGYMKEYAEEILELEQNASSEHDPVLALSSFVQYIPYKIPPDFVGKKQDKKFINGFFPPIVCFSKGWGDCDTKSILLASLLASHSPDVEQGAILFPDHMILAVAGDPLPGQRYIQADGKYYIAIEATGKDMAPGDLTPDVEQLILDGNYQWIPLR